MNDAVYRPGGGEAYLRENNRCSDRISPLKLKRLLRKELLESYIRAATVKERYAGFIHK